MSATVTNLDDFRRASTKKGLQPDYIKYTASEMRSLLSIYMTGVGSMTYSDYLIDVGTSPTAYFYAFKRDHSGNVIDEIAIMKQRSPSKNIPYFTVRVNGAPVHQGYHFADVRRTFKENKFAPIQEAVKPFTPSGS